MQESRGVHCESVARIADVRAETGSVGMSSAIDEHLATVAQLRGLEPQVARVARRMILALRHGGKVLWMGNGGSAADSQHLAADLVGRFTRERPGFASMALTTDTSVLTAVANDYSFEHVFSRQIEAICSPQDIVVAISTSGNSRNVLAGILAARKRGAFTVGLIGAKGDIGDMVDICLRVPSQVTARIQEAHILLGHILCDWIEAELCVTSV